MFDRAIFEALQHAHSILTTDDDIGFDSDDPTPYFEHALRSKDIPIPDGFHAHSVAIGDGLPDERPHGTDDREIYFFSEMAWKEDR